MFDTDFEPVWRIGLSLTWTCTDCGYENEEWGGWLLEQTCDHCGEPRRRDELDEDDDPRGIE